MGGNLHRLPGVTGADPLRAERRQDALGHLRDDEHSAVGTDDHRREDRHLRRMAVAAFRDDGLVQDARSGATGTIAKYNLMPNDSVMVNYDIYIDVTPYPKNP